MSRPLIDSELEQIVAEDLATLADLASASEITNARLRQASVILRKLVCDDLLQKVASPRLLKVTIPIPEARKLINELQSDRETVFFQLGGYQVFGVDTACSIVERRSFAKPRAYDPNLTHEASLKAYKNQPVFLIRAIADKEIGKPQNEPLEGTITRERLIRYVAHKMGGAHFDSKREHDDFCLLDIARKVAATSLKNGIYMAGVNVEALHDPVIRAKIPLPGIGPLSKCKLDPVLLELLGAIRFLLASSAVAALQRTLHN